MEIPENLNRVWHQAAIDAQRAAAERVRPSVLFRPVLSRDGNQWCALLGENLQEGVAGFGKTPDEAMRSFDRAWTTSHAWAERSG